MDKPKISASEMAKRIDHTLLKPDASRPSFDSFCSEAVRYGFKAVCVNSAWVARVAQKVRGSEVAVCAV
ncbi:MAG: 2-deoxyribose-5-phosphate aldolase, partial [Desulfobacterales bacterium]|nr:2-deoxyribose-5-phosphate aldolase [Desulfobacterales bacterium]